MANVVVFGKVAGGYTLLVNDVLKQTGFWYYTIIRTFFITQVPIL